MDEMNEDQIRVRSGPITCSMMRMRMMSDDDEMVELRECLGFIQSGGTQASLMYLMY